MTALLPGPGALALFAAAVAVLNATPGVDVLLTVTRTLQGGGRAGLVAALGLLFIAIALRLLGTRPVPA